MSEVILVADDEKEIADLVALYLENEGYRAVKCYDGTQAMDIVEKERLDLAILDIMLPGASGLDICRRIRERHNYPIIMLTAKGEETDKRTPHHGRGRLHDQALPAVGAGGTGEGPAAPVQTVQHGPAAG